MVVLVLIDAFRWDYPKRTDYIRRLGQRGVCGDFIEPFGFVPRDAYFGGLSPEQVGYTHLFHRDPARSPFEVVSGLQRLAECAPQVMDVSWRALIEAATRRRVTPFVRQYLSSLQIPLALVNQFNFSEQYAPWEKGKGYTSIFDLLDRAGRRWFHCSWPYTNAITPRDDLSLVNYCVENLKAEHDFAYIHLMELDSTGHVHGPESAPLHERLQVTDQCIRQLHEHCRSLAGEDLTMILFGDHGMVTVTRQIDLWSALQQTGLKLKHDYLCFLDSTMARFWFQHEAARRTITQLLREQVGGRVLEEADLERFDIKGCRPENAQLIFMAEPGVVIQPNFFDFSPACGVKGMHGYDPLSLDNRGTILWHCEDGRTRGRFDGGFSARALFPLLLQELHLEASSSVALPAVVPLSEDENQLTCVPEAERFVRAQVDRAVQEIVAEIPGVKSVYLAGGFGRGEGTVRREGAGYQAVNDYDIGVVVDRVNGFDSKALGRRLAQQFSMPYVDVCLTEPFNAYWPGTQTNFDLRHGSRVLWGDGRIFDAMPCYCAADISCLDACQLIYNRLSGFLTAALTCENEALGVEASGREHFAYQLTKARIALGDALLLAWGAYDVSYGKRQRRLRELLRGWPEISTADATFIDVGYEEKLRLYAFDFTAVLREIRRLPDLALRVMRLVGRRLAPQARLLTWDDCLVAIDAAYRGVVDGVADNARLAPVFAQHGVRWSGEGMHRQQLYGVLTHLAFCLLADEAHRARHWLALREHLARAGELSVPENFNWDHALRLQRRYTAIWEATCH